MLESDGTKVKKKVLSLSNPGDMQFVVEGLIEYSFFNEPKSLTDVAKHLYIDGKEEELVLDGILRVVVVEGILKEEWGEYAKV